MGVGLERLVGTSTGLAGAAARPAVARPGRADAGRADARRRARLRAGLVVGVLAAVGGALVWAQAAPGTSAVPTAEMGRLLRFMALVKAVVPAGALWGLLRRVRRPVAAGRLAAYAAGLWGAAAGAALVGQLGHVGLGAALFHGGWLAMAAAAWRDGALVGGRAIR
jgi:hypothetical protein